MTPLDKLIVEVRCNEYTIRRANPHVPFSPEEIAADAAACREAGAAILQFHAREPKRGAPAHDAACYGDSIRRIRAALIPALIPALAAHAATRPDLAPVDFLPENVDIVCSVNNGGGNRLPLVAAAIERGGHIAIGLGDYAYPELGMPTNAELVREVARIARGCGRELATPAEVRERLGIARNSPPL